MKAIYSIFSNIRLESGVNQINNFTIWKRFPPVRLSVETILWVWAYRGLIKHLFRYSFRPFTYLSSSSGNRTHDVLIVSLFPVTTRPGLHPSQAIMHFLATYKCCRRWTFHWICFWSRLKTFESTLNGARLIFMVILSHKTSSLSKNGNANFFRHQKFFFLLFDFKNVLQRRN